MVNRRVLPIVMIVAIGAAALYGQNLVGSVPSHGNTGRIDVLKDDVWISDGKTLWYARLPDLAWSSKPLPHHDIDVQFHFLNAKEGWILVGERLYYTENRGSAWSEVQFSRDFQIEGFSVAPGGQVWAFGARRGRVLTKREALDSPKYTTEELANGTVVALIPTFKVRDGHNSWKTFAVQNIQGPAKTLYFGHDHILFADPWHLYWSNDGGRVWKASSCSSRFNPDCQDETPAVLSGIESEFWCGTTDGAIQHSEDGGQKWKTLSYIDTNQHHGIERLTFLTRNVGFVLSYGRIFRTNDGGRSWRDLGLGQAEDMASYDQRLLILTKDGLYAVQEPQ
ncbi:MAG TPA: hypothetical protein VNW97_14660 [Candidatus Saccharimonadales bacterium]|jgi:hypothetical protein|nr:hypothetical protein [Candidatus Saccharimonadales bacterium]